MEINIVLKEWVKWEVEAAAAGPVDCQLKTHNTISPNSTEPKMLVRSYISHTSNEYNEVERRFSDRWSSAHYLDRSTRIITENPYAMITDRQDLGVQERRWWVQTVSDKGGVPELPQQHVEQQLGVWRVQSSSHQVSPDARSSGSRSSKQQKNLKNIFMSWSTSSSETVHLTVLIYYAFSILNSYIIH